MASAIPYDPDEGLEHNPFASESSPYSPESPSQEAAADVANAGDSIYGVAPERTTGGEVDKDSKTQKPAEEGSLSETAQDVGKDNAKETATFSEPKAGPRRQLKKYRLTTKVTAIERQGKKDPIIRFDAYVSTICFRANQLFIITKLLTDRLRYLDSEQQHSVI